MEEDEKYERTVGKMLFSQDTVLLKYELKRDVILELIWNPRYSVPAVVSIDISSIEAIVEQRRSF